jgi:hypothetical protein
MNLLGRMGWFFYLGDVNALGRNSLEEIGKEGVVDEIAIFFKKFTYCQ